MRNDLDGAVDAYREVIRLEPKNAEAHYNLATALAAQEKNDEANAELEEARRLKPGIDDRPDDQAR